MELPHYAGLMVNLGLLAPEQPAQQQERPGGRQRDAGVDQHEHQYPVVALVELLAQHRVLVLPLHLDQLRIVGRLFHLVLDAMGLPLAVERLPPVALRGGDVPVDGVEYQAIVLVVYWQF